MNMQELRNAFIRQLLRNFPFITKAERNAEIRAFVELQWMIFDAQHAKAQAELARNGTYAI